MARARDPFVLLCSRRLCAPSIGSERVCVCVTQMHVNAGGGVAIKALFARRKSKTTLKFSARDFS
jgi:hypothetical protein